MRYIDESLENRSVLITGGAGFIGSNLAFHLQENYPKTKVVVLDRFRDEKRFSNGNLVSFGHFKNLIGFKGEVIEGDINDKDLIKKLSDYNFDIIFHEAAISDTTVKDQSLMIKTNVNAFKDLLDLAVASHAKMIYASSGATYGSAPAPQRVGRENPGNVYGFSKLMMDNIAYEYMKKYPHLTIVGLRYFNVYGSREYFKDKTASMVLQLGLQILSGKRPRLFYNSDKILRDFIYIEDVIQANMKAIEAKKSGVYNVGTGVARSFEDIAKILLKELGSDLEIEYFENPYDKKAYQNFTQADIEDTKKYLGYEPKFSLEEGIKAYLPEIKRIYEEEVK
ncbi:MAG: ADP-glyceromanno-heptose 6-epimerase [Epsilonproteobacteria bacterium]|nr:ADP-glyceromanno-heptose 6-epimerase [Campylobacterota bacterium]